MESQNLSFRVAKEDLVAAVSWVARNLPTKPTQPVLRAMLITATDDGLELAGYDYEVSSRIRIPAEIITPGRIAVAGKLLSEISATLPNRPIEVSHDGSKVSINSGTVHFELPLIPLEDYPTLPQLPELTGEIIPRLFSEAITEVACAAGKDDSLPMLTGINMEINGDSISLAATDRFRLAVRKFKWNPTDPTVNAKLLVPAKTLLENAKALDAQQLNPIGIAVGSSQKVGADGLFGISTENRETTSRLLDADFPNIAPLLPKEHSAIASIEIEPLLDALKRVSILADKSSMVSLEFSSGQVILSAGGSDSGHAEEKLPCAFTGKELSVAFNPRFFRDGISVIPTKRVFFGFTEPTRPVILIPEPQEVPQADDRGMFASPDTDYIYLLMPMRLPS